MLTPEDIILAVRDKGNDAADLRDAAHEAYHAIETGLHNLPWSRANIHEALMMKSPTVRAKSEIMARAVEQVVCADFGIDPGTVEKWAFTACVEARASFIKYPSIKWFADAVRKAMVTDDARSAADKILAMGRSTTKTEV